MAKVTPYTAEVTIWGKKFRGTGKTVAEAIAKINPGRTPKGRGILVVSKGKERKEKLLTPYAMSRLFAMSPTMREVQLKNVALLFDL